MTVKPTGTGTILDDAVGAVIDRGRPVLRQAGNLGRGFLDWLAAAPRTTSSVVNAQDQNQAPDFSIVVSRAALDLSVPDVAVDHAAARIRSGGYHPQAKNFGRLRCLRAHVHGSDATCVACTDERGQRVWVRCYGSDEVAIRRLLVTSRARLLGRVSPLCDACGVHDVEPPPKVPSLIMRVPEGEVMWPLSGKKLRVSRDGGKTWGTAVSGATPANLGATPTDESLATTLDPARAAQAFDVLSRAWAKMEDWYDHANPRCPCRFATGPLVQKWREWRAAWDPQRPDYVGLGQQEEALRLAILERQRALAKSDQDADADPEPTPATAMDQTAGVGPESDLGGVLDDPQGFIDALSGKASDPDGNLGCGAVDPTEAETIRAAWTFASTLNEGDRVLADGRPATVVTTERDRCGRGSKSYVLLHYDDKSYPHTGDEWKDMVSADRVDARQVTRLDDTGDADTDRLLTFLKNQNPSLSIDTLAAFLQAMSSTSGALLLPGVAPSDDVRYLRTADEPTSLDAKFLHDGTLVTVNLHGLRVQRLDPRRMQDQDATRTSSEGTIAKGVAAAKTAPTADRAYAYLRAVNTDAVRGAAVRGALSALAGRRRTVLLPGDPVPVGTRVLTGDEEVRDGTWDYYDAPVRGDPTMVTLRATGLRVAAPVEDKVGEVEADVGVGSVTVSTGVALAAGAVAAALVAGGVVLWRAVRGATGIVDALATENLTVAPLRPDTKVVAVDDPRLTRARQRMTVGQSAALDALLRGDRGRPKKAVVELPPAATGNVIDDLDHAWSICKFCKRVGAVIGGVDGGLDDDGDLAYAAALRGEDPDDLTVADGIGDDLFNAAMDVTSVVVPGGSLLAAGGRAAKSAADRATGHDPTGGKGDTSPVPKPQPQPQRRTPKPPPQVTVVRPPASVSSASVPVTTRAPTPAELTDQRGVPPPSVSAVPPLTRRQAQQFRTQALAAVPNLTPWEADLLAAVAHRGCAVLVPPNVELQAGYRVATADEAAACVTRSTTGTAPEVARVLTDRTIATGVAFWVPVTAALRGQGTAPTPTYSIYNSTLLPLDGESHGAYLKREPTKPHALLPEGDDSWVWSARSNVWQAQSGVSGLASDYLAALSGQDPDPGPVTLYAGPEVPLDEAFAALSTAHHMIDAGERGDPLAVIRAAKQAAVNQFRYLPWYRAAGIGLDADGATVRLMVDRLTHEVRAAVPATVSPPDSDVRVPLRVVEMDMQFDAQDADHKREPTTVAGYRSRLSETVGANDELSGVDGLGAILSTTWEVEPETLVEALAGYKSLAAQNKAPDPPESGDPLEGLDGTSHHNYGTVGAGTGVVVGDGDVLLGDFLGDADAWADDPAAALDATDDQVRVAVEDKVQELASTHAAVRERIAQGTAATRAALLPAYHAWTALWRQREASGREATVDQVNGVVHATNHALENVGALPGFGPSEEVEARVRHAHEVAEEVRALAAKDPKLAAVVRALLDSWDAFYSKWNSVWRATADAMSFGAFGAKDLDAVNAAIADVNTMSVNAKNFRPDGYDANAKRVTPATDSARTQNVDPGALSTARGGAVAVDDAARKAQQAAEEAAKPTTGKLLALGAAAGAAVLLALKVAAKSVLL